METRKYRSDMISFGLFLLFIAAFFGVATEQSRRPYGASIEINAQAAGFPEVLSDVRNHMARKFDLLSIEQNGERGPIGSRSEKLEVPATGK